MNTHSVSHEQAIENATVSASDRYFFYKLYWEFKVIFLKSECCTRFLKMIELWGGRGEEGRAGREGREENKKGKRREEESREEQGKRGGRDQKFINKVINMI